MSSYVGSKKIHGRTDWFAMLIPSILLLFFVSVSVQYCSALDSISARQPLQDASFIVASGGIFKLGFFSPENTTNRYVGIMYNVPKLTVVWVANRDRPLNDSSGILTVSEDGNLVILDGKKEILWSSNATNPATNSTAQLLENGNFILRDDSNRRSVWESFQIPTDTFLEGMRFGGSENHTIQLTSWRSPSDPAIGNFTFGINPLRIPETFIWNKGALYWRNGPWNGNTFIGIPEMSPVYGVRVNMVADNAGAIYFTYDDKNNSRLLHYKLSYTGLFQELVVNINGDWDATFPRERNECDLYGNCGPNGICNPKGSQICSCLHGFEPRDRVQWTKGNWSSGCLRKSPLQCSQNISVGKEDGYFKFTNVKVPDLSYYVPAAEVDCGNECLKNCSCSAYTFVVGIGCLHWADYMIDVQQFSIRSLDLYLRLAHSELDSVSSKHKKKAIAATVGCLVLAVLLYYIMCYCRIKHQGGKFKKEILLSEDSEKLLLEELPLHSYETMASATDNFNAKNKLGQGGFGPVYKGKLSDGQEIAVKRLSISSGQGTQEFMNEVTVISKLQHRNLVRLLGCCAEGAEKMLVYEYLPNKSLDVYLYDLQKQDLLDWNRRSIIIEGISRGLLYLHRDSRLRVIHRDLKASNILLDEDLNPKISDFGLARIFCGKQDQAKTNRIVGTYGYMAPEYAMGGNFSEKSDVYSFGVLLLEIVTGKKIYSFYSDEENLSLVGFAWKLWNENKAVSLAFAVNLDPAIEMEFLRCVHIGLLCVQESANDRPNMFDVLLMLNSEITELPQPKLPAYTARLSPVPRSLSSLQNVYTVNDVSITDIQGR